MVFRKIAPRLCLIATLLSVSATAQAPNDVRVALVIGNAAYPGKLALANPANDAAAVGAALSRLGFTVIEAKDASRPQMEDAIKKLFGALKGRQGIGLLYYAGHGLQLDWKNYMVPVDAKLRVASDVPAQTVDVADVLDALEAAGSRLKVVILDACRDNPFEGKGAAKGLAPVDAPTGTFLAYATAPGNVAEDGTGSNGLYTKHLLEELKRPDTIEATFRRVRLNVRKESGGRQIPWESTSLEEEFSFASKPAFSAAAAATRRDADFAEQKAEWDRIKDSGKAEDLFAFLNKYPNGLISEIAQVRLEKLAGSSLKTQGLKGEAPIERVTDRLQPGDEWKVRVVHKGVGFFGGDDVSENLHRVTRRVGENLEIVVQPSGAMTQRTVKIVTPQGANVSADIGMMGKYESSPPGAVVPQTAYQVGQKTSSRVEMFRNGKSQGVEDYDVNVAAREKITTPLGSFEAYKIELRTRTTGAFGSTARSYTITNWYTQNSIIPLRSQFVMSGTPTTEEETVWIKRAAPG